MADTILDKLDANIGQGDFVDAGALSMMLWNLRNGRMFHEDESDVE